MSESEPPVASSPSSGRRSAADRVGSILSAAELLDTARAEADRLRRDGGEQAEQAMTTATSEALAIAGRARQDADRTLEQAGRAAARRQREAEQYRSAARRQREAERYSRELIGEARQAAEEVRREGLELVANLRQMGESLRSNAERLLRDVQGIHRQMVARIERAEWGFRGGATARRRPRSATRRSSVRGRPAASADEEIPEVPEFIPRG